MSKYFKTIENDKIIFLYIDEEIIIIVEHFENDKSIGRIDIIKNEFSEEEFLSIDMEPVKENEFLYAISDIQSAIQNIINKIR